MYTDTEKINMDEPEIIVQHVVICDFMHFYFPLLLMGKHLVYTNNASTSSMKYTVSYMYMHDNNIHIICTKLVSFPFFKMHFLRHNMNLCSYLDIEKNSVKDTFI